MTAGGPQFSATPQNPDLLRWIGIQVLLLAIAWVIGMVVRRLLASRMTMSTASATLTGLGGLWGGLLVAGWIFSSSDMWRPAMIGVAALVAAIVVVIVSLLPICTRTPASSPSPRSPNAANPTPSNSNRAPAGTCAQASVTRPWKPSSRRRSPRS